MKQKESLPPRRKKWIVGIGLGLFIVLSLLAGYFAGRPLVAFASEPEKFRAWVDSQGLWGPALFVGMVVLQVVVALIPGEPLEIAAGYAFGPWWGTVLCIAGMTLGSVLVFLAVRKWGTKIIEIFFPLEKLQNLPFLQNEKKLHFWIFLAFFLPGTPKDLLCYAVGLTNIPLSHWIAISAVARIPSVITSTLGGDALGTQNYGMAAVVFIATGIISLLGLWLYRVCSCRRERSS